MAFKLKQRTKTQCIESDLLRYYKSIVGKPTLFIEANHVNMETGKFVLDVVNMIVLFLYERYILSEYIDLWILILPHNIPCSKDRVEVEYESLFTLDVDRYPSVSRKILEIDELGKYPIFGGIELSKRPSVSVHEKGLIISGLTPVLRFLLKYCTLVQKHDPNFIETGKTILRTEMKSILGFRSGCLQACAEASIWTKFCELDMPGRMISSLISEVKKCVSSSDGELQLPQDLLRFEYHLTQPVKIHNFLKRVQQEEKQMINGNQAGADHNSVLPPVYECNNDIHSSVNVKGISKIQPQLLHTYAEGPDITLSDVILFPCVELVNRHLGNIILNHLPNVRAWYHKVQMVLKETPLRIQLLDRNAIFSAPDSFNPKLVLPELPQESLYKSDPARDTPSQFTKQEDIREALDLIAVSGIEPMMAGLDPVSKLEPLLDWKSLPPLIHPEEGGQLPPKRRQKKCDQLANLVQMLQFVYEQSRSGNNGRNQESEHVHNPLRIVDFCSGGGHVGILVAWLFPNFHVILVENKEESVRRALERVEKLKLSNISVFQCNLNSFVGNFDIGIALHACGTATDLVLEKCSRAKASFIVCPCCYGAIRRNHLLHYPRSSAFSESGLTVNQYLVLAHAADQTHDEENVKTAQGKLSMRIIDTDRLLNLHHQYGYQVWLGKITPETASPKNHILLGIAKV